MACEICCVKAQHYFHPRDTSVEQIFQSAGESLVSDTFKVWAHLGMRCDVTSLTCNRSLQDGLGELTSCNTSKTEWLTICPFYWQFFFLAELSASCHTVHYKQIIISNRYYRATFVKITPNYPLPGDIRFPHGQWSPPGIQWSPLLGHRIVPLQETQRNLDCLTCWSVSLTAELGAHE